MANPIGIRVPADAGGADTRGRGPPTTPDGRYILVRGRLWRCSDPQLSEDRRHELVDTLMNARRAVAAALKAGDPEALRAARRAVDVAKRALGERGPVWWTDGAPDFTRRLARNTPYADWGSSAGCDPTG